MRPPHEPPPRAKRWLEFAALATLLTVSGFLIWRRMSLPDIFEDGYHHWWIGAHWAESGTYVDPMSLMTNGSWLPGYYPLVAGLYSLAGWGALDLLRWIGLAASLITLLLVYGMARRHGLAAGLFAALFFGVAIQTSLIGSMAVPEPLVVLAMTGGVYLLWFSRWSREEIRYALAAALFLAAAILRYEAWLAVSLLPIHAWFLDRPRFRVFALTALPSFVFMALWAVALLPGGLLPAIVVGQTAREAQNQLLLGTIPANPWDRFGWFWFGNYAAGLLPLFVLGPAYMVCRLRREYPTWLSLGLFAGVTALVVGGLGTGSYRYVAIAVPFVAVAAGRAVQGIAHILLRLSRPSLARVAVAGLLIALVVASAANTAWITPKLDSVGLLNAPLERAGVWISQQPWDEGKRLLSDSPIATYYSRVDPALAWSSWWLPSNRTDALMILRAQYEYIVFVNVSYYPLHQLFPELANGTSSTDFVLVYNANAWEEEYGAKAVYVYTPRP